MTHPGLDITAGVLPFFRRLGATGAGAGGSESVDIFCRLVRLVDGNLVGSGSGSGLASRAGAFRLREGGGRVEGVVEGIEAAELPDTESSEEDAACLADARVILEDMSISVEC